MDMLKHLKGVLAKAKLLGEAEGFSKISIGIENLVWDEGIDFPVDGFAYVGMTADEGNCGVYRSYKWLVALIDDFEKYVNNIKFADIDLE